MSHAAFTATARALDHWDRFQAVGQITLPTHVEADKADATIRALNQASGWLRSKLGRAMRIRSVPELHFHHDSSVETGRHMDDLIDSAIAADRRAPGTDETDSD